MRLLIKYLAQTARPYCHKHGPLRSIPSSRKHINARVPSENISHIADALNSGSPVAGHTQNMSPAIFRGASLPHQIASSPSIFGDYSRSAKNPIARDNNLFLEFTNHISYNLPPTRGQQTRKIRHGSLHSAPRSESGLGERALDTNFCPTNINGRQ